MTREELHELVDDVPEERLDSVGAFLVEVLEHEEPLTADDIAGLDESAADVEAGRTRPMVAAIEELGL